MSADLSDLFANICQGLVWSQVFTWRIFYILNIYTFIPLLHQFLTGQESKGCRAFCLLAWTWVFHFQQTLQLYLMALQWLSRFAKDISPSSDGFRKSCHIIFDSWVEIHQVTGIVIILITFPCHFVSAHAVQTRWSMLPRWWKAWLSCSSAKLHSHKSKIAKTKNTHLVHSCSGTCLSLAMHRFLVPYRPQSPETSRSFMGLAMMWIKSYLDAILYKIFISLRFWRMFPFCNIMELLFADRPSSKHINCIHTCHNPWTAHLAWKSEAANPHPCRSLGFAKRHLGRCWCSDAQRRGSQWQISMCLGVKR